MTFVHRKQKQKRTTQSLNLLRPGFSLSPTNLCRSRRALIGVDLVQHWNSQNDTFSTLQFWFHSQFGTLKRWHKMKQESFWSVSKSAPCSRSHRTEIKTVWLQTQSLMHRHCFVLTQHGMHQPFFQTWKNHGFFWQTFWALSPPSTREVDMR